MKQGNSSWSIHVGLDTGARVSVMSREKLIKMGLAWKIKPSDVQIQGVGGNPLPVWGEITLTITFGSFTSDVTFIVTNLFEGIDALLGCDFAQAHKLTITSSPWTVTIDGKEIPIENEPHRESPRSRSEEKSRIIICGIRSSIPGKESSQASDPKLTKTDYCSCTSTKTGKKKNINAYEVVFSETCDVAPNSYGTKQAIIRDRKFQGGESYLFEPSEDNADASIFFSGIVHVPAGQKEVSLPYVNIRKTPVGVIRKRKVGTLRPLMTQSFTEDDGNTIGSVLKEERLDDGTTRISKLLKEVEKTFHMGSKEYEAIRDLIYKYPNVFSLEDEPLTISNTFFHEIITEGKPVYTRPYTIPLKYHEQIREKIGDLVKRGVLRPSKSPYNHPLVPVVKKDGSIRLCLDFRRLNEQILNDTYPLPNIDLVLAQMGKSKFFTSLDLREGYHQIPLTEASCEKTAFTSPEGRYEYLTLPFGLKDAPASFQRIINQVLAGVIGQVGWCYLDDILVTGHDWDSHLANLTEVVRRLSKAKLSLKLEKCRFFQKEVDFLGHVVSQEGIKAQPQKIKAIRDFPRPKTLRELQSFLGLANYYRKFLENFSKMARPLYELTKMGKRKTKPSQLIDWNNEAEMSFVKIKDVISREVVLSLPDFSRPFSLTTDASDYAIGGVLQQEDDQGRLRPLSFFSRLLNKAERNYSTLEREALAIVYGLKVNRPLLLGHKVRILTDHRPLKYIFSTNSNNTRVARWRLQVAEYDIEVDYLTGKDNVVADALSRIRLDEEVIGAVTLDDGTRADEVLEWNLRSLSVAQNKDVKWGKLKEYLRGNSEVIPKLPVPVGQFRLGEDGLLYRLFQDKYAHKIRQIVIPSAFVHKVIKLNHVLPIAGHGGKNATLARLRRMAYWPSMVRDVEKFLKSCKVCLKFKPARCAKAPILKYPEVTRPFQRVHLDLIGPLPVSDHGHRYILTVIDSFTRYGIAAPLKTKSAKEVAEAYVRQVISIFGTPESVVSDNGGEFLAEVFQGVQTILGIKHSTVTPYHPAANGMAERFNGSLIRILRTMVDDVASCWDEMLPLALLAYNTAYHRIIGDTPFFLTFLRDPCLPFIKFCRPGRCYYNIDDYRQKLLATAGMVFELVQREVAMSLPNAPGPRKLNRPFTVGDRVYIKNVKKSGESRKFAPLYVGPYRVLKIINPVILKIRNLGTGKVLNVHIDRVKVVAESEISIDENPYVGRPYPLPDESLHSHMQQDNVPWEEWLLRDLEGVDIDEEADALALENVDEEKDSMGMESDRDCVNERTNQVSAGENSGEALPGASAPNPITNPAPPIPSHPYSLRSSSRVPEFPRVMDKPLEYINSHSRYGS